MIKPSNLYAWTDSSLNNTVYTTSMTLSTGMALYNNIGEATGATIGVINGNMFDIASITLTLVYAEMSSPLESGWCKLDDINITDIGTYALTKGVPHYIKLIASGAGPNSLYDSNNQSIGTSVYEEAFYWRKYEFIPTSDLTIKIYID